MTSLEGRYVRLEPLSLEHLAALCEVGFDDSLWRWTTVRVGSREEMRGYIEAALSLQQAGSAIPFATVERASGRVVGSTRFMNISVSDKRVEIGSTWIAPAWQRTAINTEAKSLMMGYAFERLGCNRVELKTDALNQQSRRAILRIGAREEGILRSHMICYDGRLRDSVYFSVIASEWPQVKANLEARLARN